MGEGVFLGPSSRRAERVSARRRVAAGAHDVSSAPAPESARRVRVEEALWTALQRGRMDDRSLLEAGPWVCPDEEFWCPMGLSGSSTVVLGRSPTEGGA